MPNDFDRKLIETVSRLTIFVGAHPESLDAHLELALTLIDAERLEEARMLVEHSETITPNHHKICLCRHNLAVALYRAERFEESAQQHLTNVQKHPNHIPGWRDFAQALVSAGQSDQGIDVLNQARRNFPQDRETRFALGLAALRLGQWKTGWSAYEARWLPGEWEKRIPLGCSACDGKPLSTDQRLIVISEQGLGDNLLFARYLPLLQTLVTNITYVAHPALVTLFQASFPEIQVTDKMEAMEGDVCISIASLPLRLIAQSESPPKHIPYLAPNAAVCDPALLQIVATLPKPFIGIVWRGGGHQGNKSLANRSLRLSDVLPAIPEFFQHTGSIVSLQKDPTPEEEKHLAELGIVDLSPALTDFNATALIVNAAECLLSVDTALAHLAGGLGKPVILLQRPEGDWRWGDDFSGQHWYSNVTPIVIQRQ